MDRLPFASEGVLSEVADMYPVGGEPDEVNISLPMPTPMTTADDVLDSIRGFMAASPAQRC